MRARIGLVGELIHIEMSGPLSGNARGNVLVILGVTLGHIAASQNHLGAHGAQVADFFVAHFVGHNHNQLVAFLRRHQRQRQAGVARGGLNKRAAWLQRARSLGFFNHGHGNSVLNRPARIHVLHLHK